MTQFEFSLTVTALYTSCSLLILQHSVWFTFTSKKRNNRNIIDHNSDAVIFGCWISGMAETDDIHSPDIHLHQHSFLFLQCVEFIQSMQFCCLFVKIVVDKYVFLIHLTYADHDNFTGYADTTCAWRITFVSVYHPLRLSFNAQAVLSKTWLLILVSLREVFCTFTVICHGSGIHLLKIDMYKK